MAMAAGPPLNTASRCSDAPSQSSSALVVDDNPCWGGPTLDRHNLDYLLRVLGSSSTSTITAASCSIVEPSSFSPETLLQRVIDRVILYQDNNYIVVSKPPDLRMDGPYAATVHKLLLYLYPPPSLLLHLQQQQQQQQEEFSFDTNNIHISKTNHDNKEDTTSNPTQHNQQLIVSIASVSNRSCIPDDPIRWIHQLDYATSGILLVGRNKHATAVACKSFELRNVCKVYSAVVISSSFKNVGDNNTTNADDDCHLPSSSPPLTKDFINSLPTLPYTSLDSWCNGTLEKQYKKKRQRETTMTNNNGGRTMTYATISHVFDRWRRELIVDSNQSQQQGGVGNNDQAMTTIRLTKRKKNNNKKRSSLLPELPKPNVTLTPTDITRLLSYGQSWKLVKRSLLHNSRGDDDDKKKNERINWITIVETMTKEYNVLLKEYYSTHKEDGSLLSTIASNNGGHEVSCVSGDDDLLPPLFRIDNDDQDTFYMCASIGEMNGRFRVLVDPTVSLSQVDEDDISSIYNSNNNNNNDDSISPPQMRPALTKCQVVWRGKYHYNNTDNVQQQEQQSSIHVAKVLLYPHTGRRHQLRVHLAYIAGCPILGDATYGGNYLTTAVNNNYSSKGTQHDNATAPSLRGYVCRRMCLHARELTIPLIGNETRTFVAPDPFVVVTNNDDNHDEETLVIV